MPIFTLFNDYLVVHSKGDIEEKKIYIPKLETYQQHRQWMDKTNIVYELADNLTDKLKIGDKIILDTHAKLRRMDEITKLVADSEGIKTTRQILDKEGKNIGEEELEKYFIVKIDDVLCIVNN